MQSRLFKTPEWSYENGLKSLSGNDVISARVSDHHPIIHDGVLFWNVMMQGKMQSRNNGYNNGFGIVESDDDYVNRLGKVAQVIAEIVYRHPTINVICLCEGPIQPLHVNAFIQSFIKYSFMNRFFNTTEVFYKQDIDGFQNWGLLMLADKKYKVNDVKLDLTLYSKLTNRFHLWQLTNNGKTKYLALGHFPFEGNEYKTRSEDLTLNGKSYCNLVNDVLNQYANDRLIVCADFNLNPHLIGEINNREMDRIANNNSILLNKGEGQPAINTVTVDGILLSLREKQRYYNFGYDTSMSMMIIKENNLLRSNTRVHLEDYRHKSSYHQREYDRRFGLISC